MKISSPKIILGLRKFFDANKNCISLQVHFRPKPVYGLPINVLTPILSDVDFIIERPRQLSHWSCRANK